VFRAGCSGHHRRKMYYRIDVREEVVELLAAFPLL